MLDACLINSYLIWKGITPDSSFQAHRRFQESVSKDLRNTPYLEPEKRANKRPRGNSMSAPNWNALSHSWTQFEGNGYVRGVRRTLRSGIPSGLDAFWPK
jgi:hypothetical protein